MCLAFAKHLPKSITNKSFTKTDCTVPLFAGFFFMEFFQYRIIRKNLFMKKIMSVLVVSFFATQVMAQTTKKAVPPPPPPVPPIEISMVAPPPPPPPPAPSLVDEDNLKSIPPAPPLPPPPPLPPKAPKKQKHNKNNVQFTPPTIVKDKEK